MPSTVLSLETGPAEVCTTSVWAGMGSLALAVTGAGALCGAGVCVDAQLKVAASDRQDNERKRVGIGPPTSKKGAPILTANASVINVRRRLRHLVQVIGADLHQRFAGER